MQEFLRDELTCACLSCFVIRSEGDDREAGKEEAGGEGDADALGGVLGEEEGEEEAEEEEQEGEESGGDWKTPAGSDVKSVC